MEGGDVTGRIERGFTLVELAVAMAIVAMMAALMMPNMVEELNARRAGIAIQETQTIVDAARTFRAQTGAWPGGATCLGALNALRTTTPPLLVGINNTNKYNSAYSTSCTANTFSVDQNAVADWDGYIANSLPGTAVADPATWLLRTTIGIPGSEPALDNKLSRVATGNAELNRMRTTLLLGNNNISEVNNMSGQSVTLTGNMSSGSATVSGNVQAGTASVTGNVQAGSATVAGNVQAGSASVAGNATVNGQMSAGTISSSGQTTVWGLFDARGQSQFAGRATFNGEVVLNRVVTEGGGCSPNGSIARDSTGKTLSCQSGVWAAAAISVLRGTMCGISFSGCTNSGHLTALCDGHNPASSCPAGYGRTSWNEGNNCGLTTRFSCIKL